MRKFDTAEDIRRALEKHPEQAAEKLLAIIVSRNVDPIKIYELAQIYVNPDHQEQLNEMLNGGGWTLIRLQTEWSQMSGHRTFAYLARIIGGG
jgi:hypothetical protein